MFLEIVKAPHWAREPYYIRRRPDYSSNTPGRAANRLRFLEAAVSARGKPFGEMPPAAEAVAATAAPLVEVEPGPIAPMNEPLKKLLAVQPTGHTR